MNVLALPVSKGRSVCRGCGETKRPEAKGMCKKCYNSAYYAKHQNGPLPGLHRYRIVCRHLPSGMIMNRAFVVDAEDMDDAYILAKYRILNDGGGEFKFIGVHCIGRGVKGSNVVERVDFEIGDHEAGCERSTN